MCWFSEGDDILTSGPDVEEAHAVLDRWVSRCITSGPRNMFLIICVNCHDFHSEMDFILLFEVFQNILSSKRFLFKGSKWADSLAWDHSPVVKVVAPVHVIVSQDRGIETVNGIWQIFWRGKTVL